MFVELESSGDSPHAIASNLNGELAAAVENGTIPRTVAELLAVDLFGWAISSTAARGRQARVDCTVIRFTVDQGVARSEALYLDGSSAEEEGTDTPCLHGAEPGE